MTALFILFLFVPFLVGLLLGLNLLFSVHKPDSEKVSPFECGFAPIFGQTRSPFHIQFYLVAILFLVLDLEIFYMVPFAVVVYSVGSYGFSIFLIFFIILTLGFVYEISSGLLQFSDQKFNDSKKYNKPTPLSSSSSSSPLTRGLTNAPPKLIRTRFYSTSKDKFYSPAAVYSNADLNKLEIVKENKGKSGVYL